MGTYHTAQLVYGVDLGHSEKFLIEEASEDGSPALPWMSKADPWGRIASVRKHFGVQLLEHGWLTEGDSRSFVLAAHVIRVDGGDARPVSLMDLIEDSASERYDEKLAEAVRVLGITPKKQPSWLLLATR
jgi:hypothetical protein